MSDEMKRARRPAPRRRFAASEGSSPSPMDIGPVCGHDGGGCGGGTCNVRYVGPTTSVRDHHAIHAARGVSPVWTAAIVSGFAIVLTGAIAWSSVSAAIETKDARKAATPSSEQALMARLERLERLVMETRDACKANTAAKGLKVNTQ